MSMDTNMGGCVKWWSDQKGFGFITGDDGTDYFAHYTAIVGSGYRTLEADQRVEFEGQDTDRGPAATEIVGL